MGNLLRTILENCALEVRKDDTGWHVVARGALGIVGILALVAIFALR